MFRLLVVVALTAFVLGQDHHAPGGTGNHHHHPGGHFDCTQTSDCPSCNSTTQTESCVDHVCMCTTVVKRAGEPCKTVADCADVTCNHGAPNCEIHDPTMEHGHCNCHAKKRAGEPCKTTADCADITCNHGSPNCEIHDPALEHGHCNCH